MAFLERPLAVQIQQAINIGAPQREQHEEDEDVGEKNFDSIYLDRALVKEKKKFSREANRMMKLSLTDGLNKMEAIEYERLSEFD